jgi:hypothetical protein
MRWMGIVMLVVVGAASVALALLFWRRAETGKWEAPEAIAEAVQDRVESVFDDRPRVPRTIWMVRGGVTLRGGADDSAARVSSVVGNAKGNPDKVVVPRFRGSDRTWKQLMACVQAQYARFDVLVTDEEPRDVASGFVLVAVGGKPALVGSPARTGGLAPMIPGVVVEDPVVFVFSDALGNRVQPMCETAAMEIAHTFGLDHEYLCKDPMSYLGNCGNKTFQDKAARCGESKARVCADGLPTQNSVARLTEVLGARAVASVP